MKRNLLLLYLLLPAQLLLAQNKPVVKAAPLPDSTVKMLSYDEHGKESMVRTKPAAAESRAMAAPAANHSLPGKTTANPAAATGGLPAASAVKTTAVAKTVTATPVKKAAANAPAQPVPAAQPMPVLQTDHPAQVNH